MLCCSSVWLEHQVVVLRVAGSNPVSQPIPFLINMKVIKKTRKYLHVRMTQSELDILNQAVIKEEKKLKEEQQRIDHAKWFYSNHIEHSSQDEYSSWHTYYQNIHTGNYVQNPDFWVTIYKSRFLKEIKEVEKIWNNKKK
jgi:hypothetical protein